VVTAASGVIRDLGPRHTLIFQLDPEASIDQAADVRDVIEEVLSSLPATRRPRFLVIGGIASLAAVRVAPRSLPGRKRLPRWAR